MTRKNMVNKLAKEIYECELIHQNQNSSTEEKSHSEAKIIQLTNKIASMKDGINIMLEVDEKVQELLNSK